MSNLDTKYIINLDLIKDRANSTMKFGLIDAETSDFYLVLYNDGTRVFDKNYIVTLYIVKPNGNFRNIKLEPKESLKRYYCNLPDTLKNISGEYVCQALIFDNLTGEKKISKSKFKYSVDLDLASEMAGIIDEEEQESILTNILNRLLTLENPVEPYATQKHVDKCISTLTEEIDTIKVKDVEQDDKLTSIETKDGEQDTRLTAIETKDMEQDGRLVNIESKNTEQDNRLAGVESKNIEQDTRLTTIEAKDVEQDERLNSLENRVDGIDKKIVDTIEPSLDNYGNILNALENKDIAHESKITDIETKNTEQDNRLTNIEGIDTTQNNRLDALEAKDIAHESRMTNIEAKNTEQDNRLNSLESKDLVHESRLTNIESKNTEQDSRLDIAENRLANIGNDITNTMQPIIDGHTARLDAIEAIDVAQNSRLDAIEAKNTEQDDRLLDIEKANKRQDMDLKCLFAESKNNMIDVTEEGNSIYLQNSNNGFAAIDEIKGNTLVNCNKEPNKELILNGNINTSGDNTVTLTEGVDGGLVDVALEGNTLVNVSKTKDSTAITKAYTVENSGNHIALQGDIDGNCRPVITGNTLWIDNDTEEILTVFDGSKNLRLQSTFEDNLVIQEMVDNGEEVSDNLGKYKLEYKVTGKNKFDGELEYGGRNGDTGSLIVSKEIVRNVNNIVVKPNTSYYMTVTNTIGSFWIYEYDCNFNYLLRKSLDFSKNNKKTFTTSSNTKYIGFNSGKINTYDINEVIQIEEGDTATAYEPYKGYIKTLYLNSPLLEGDTIEEKDNGIYHVHRSELLAYTEGDETSLITDKVNTLHQLEIPQYELIEQSNLAIPSYANGHLDFNTAVPVEKVEFKPFSEELTYLYANTQYTVQFVSDKATTADITLGGTQLLAQSIVAGLNRISITTPSELVDNKLIINGNDTGANISKVVVTDTDREFGYFEGMKSVGECEELEITSTNSDDTKSNTQQLTHEPLRGLGTEKDRYVLIDGNWYIEKKCGIRAYQEGDKDNYKTDLVNTVYPLEMPTYEEIDYNPLEVYSGTTHITTNSTIPPNITVKNHGYNCLLKPSTTYTISSNLGLNTVTTPSTLTEDCLRFMDTDTSDVTTMKDVLVLEGDWTTKADLIPANFSGIESAFEQELVTDETDEHFGMYKVTAKVIGKNLFDSEIVYNVGLNGIDGSDLNSSTSISSTFIKVNSNSHYYFSELPSDATSCVYYYDGNKKYISREGGKASSARDIITPANAKFIRVTLYNSNGQTNTRDDLKAFWINIQIEKGDTATEYEPHKENNITFYINEPLRGIGDVKDRIYAKDDKVVVQRNCGIRPYQDGDFGTYLTDKVNTVYQLAEPTYEEVEYNDTKLFIESFKNSTLSYNSNVSVTSTVHYSYSVPIVDTVAQTANISDQQDSMIIDLATQCAVMEIMLM